MGKVSRLLTLNPRTRRVRLPREYLESHRLGPDAPLFVLTTSPLSRLVVTEPQWTLISTALDRLRPLAENTGRVTPHGTRVDKQGRMVIPKAAGFPADTPRVRLRYHIANGLLELTRIDAITRDDDPVDTATRAGAGLSAAQDGEPAAGDAGSRSADSRGVEAIPDPSAPVDMPVYQGPDGLFPPGPVKRVRLQDIKGVDPSLPAPAPDEVLADQIAEAGMRDPVVLHAPKPYRVIDGWKRIHVARYLEMETIPAVVFSRLERRDVQVLRYLLDTRTGPWILANQLRRLAALRRNGVSLEDLARLVRRRPRTIQRYLRIAADPDLLRKIEAGVLSIREAESRITMLTSNASSKPSG